MNSRVYDDTFTPKEYDPFPENPSSPLITGDEQSVGTSEQVPTNPTLTSVCTTCGQHIPLIDYSLENLPKLPPGAADLVLTADQARRFRTAYLELFKFWWDHNFPTKGKS